MWGFPPSRDVRILSQGGQGSKYVYLNGWWALAAQELLDRLRLASGKVIQDNVNLADFDAALQELTAATVRS